MESNVFTLYTASAVYLSLRAREKIQARSSRVFSSRALYRLYTRFGEVFFCLRERDRGKAD